MINSLSFFGLGKLGLPLAAHFARSGLQTVAIDIDTALIDRLRYGVVPYHESGLAELLAAAKPFIRYTSETQEAAQTDASIILVATPSTVSDPAFSNRYVEYACDQLCAALKSRPIWRYHLVVISSTLYVGSIAKLARYLEQKLGRTAGRDFGIAYVPDFVALGSVVRDFGCPPFLLIGSDDSNAGHQAAELYGRVSQQDTPVRILSAGEAELAKISYNLFLCMKISFANYLTQLGDRLGGIDIDAIAGTLSLDPKIGGGFMRPGAPYGGACFPRDINAFRHLAAQMQLAAPLAEAAAEINDAQFALIERHVLQHQPRCIGILGLSFKPGTPVTTESPSFEFIRRFLERAIPVVAFDPLIEARSQATETFGTKIRCVSSLEDCLTHADTVLVCNPDPAYLGITSMARAEQKIVDPWHHIRDQHPGLNRPGRDQQFNS